MRLVIPFLLLAATTIASAQQMQQQRTYMLQVTEAELMVIGRALEGLPYRDAAPVLARLQQQIIAQTQKPETPPLEQK
jgi:hypothetical protein